MATPTAIGQSRRRLSGEYEHHAIATTLTSTRLQDQRAFTMAAYRTPGYACWPANSCPYSEDSQTDNLCNAVDWMPKMLCALAGAKPAVDLKWTGWTFGRCLQPIWQRRYHSHALHAAPIFLAQWCATATEADRITCTPDCQKAKQARRSCLNILPTICPRPELATESPDKVGLRDESTDAGRNFYPPRIVRPSAKRLIYESRSGPIVILSDLRHPEPSSPPSRKGASYRRRRQTVV